MAISPQRISDLNQRPLRADGRAVVYWMAANRRRMWNPALERAVALARDLHRPLLVVEALGVRRAYSCARFHRFFLDGMRDNRTAFAGSAAAYRCWIGRRREDGPEVLAALACDACAVVVDDLPYGHLPAVNAGIARMMPVRVEAVDGNGLMPMALSPRPWERAVDFRRFLQRSLPAELGRQPLADPLAGVELPALDLPTPWASDPDTVDLAALPIDQRVGPVALRGGWQAAGAALMRFLASGVDAYHEGRNRIDDSAASGLSPWLRSGHLAAQAVVEAVWRRCAWSPGRLAGRPVTAAKEGWWGLPPGPEALMDQLITWRELGFHDARSRNGGTAYAGLPAWARATLAVHAGDPRAHGYALADLEEGRTHDPLWNAAQAQLRSTGLMHNYLRMLWGKKIIEWTASPEEAHHVLFHLNDRWALDGCTPNSSTGIMWCLGRYDRPWFPERPVFGTIRFMSSDSTRRKLDVKSYLATYGRSAETGQQRLF